MKICITGASSGIGKELAEYLVKKGSIVWGIGRRKEALERIKDKLPEGRFFYDICNVENYPEVLKTKKKMDSAGFYPDVIILGAAISQNDLKPNYNNDLFNKVFSINLFGSVNFVDIFLPYFLKRKRGHFIALSSIAAFRPNIRSISYPASKAALSMTFKGFDLTYRKKNIYFSTIYLGPVHTPMWEGEKSFIVANPKKVAKSIAKVIKTKESVSFIPFLSTFLSRISRLIPDKIYVALSEKLLK